MFLARSAALMLAVGLVASPVAALFCAEGDAAAMACCREDMSQCNQPGKTDDCCRTSPGVSRDQGALPALKSGLNAPSLDSHAALLPQSALADQAGFLVLAHAPHSVPTPQASPPRSPILRV